MRVTASVLAACAAVILLASGIAHGALINNGGGLIYDSAQNITWYDFQTDPMTFAQAQSWAAGLTIGGVAGWTLPSAGPSPSLGATTQANYNVTTSQMGYLFYVELGNQGLFAQNGSMNPLQVVGLLNQTPFENLTGSYYWTSTVYVPQARDAWYFGYTGSNFVAAATGLYAWGFDMGGGDQLVNLMTNSNSLALAVHVGDIKPQVSSPIPSAILLLAPAMAALAASRRRWRG